MSQQSPLSVLTPTLELHRWQEFLDRAVELDWKGRIDEAVQAAEAGYQAALESGEVVGAVLASHRLGLLNFNRETLAEGLQVCLRAETWTKFCPDEGAVLSLRSVHGGILVALGDIAGGMEMLVDCLQRSRRCPEALAVWRVQTAYAVALFDIMDFDGAATAAGEALAYAEVNGLLQDYLLIARCIAGRMAARALAERKLAGLEIDQALFEVTESIQTQVLTIGLKSDFAYEVAEANCCLGMLAWVRGDDAGATARYTAALMKARDVEDSGLIGLETSYWYAYLLAGQGDYAGAVSLLDGVEETVAQQQSSRVPLRYYGVRYRIAERGEDWASAFRYLKLYHGQVVADHARLSSARAYTMKISLDLENLRQKQDSARLERDRLLEENLRLAAERQASDLAARTDPLTGLGNRRELRFQCEALKAAGVEHATLMLVDLDHFKRINDVFSHAVGDNVLKAVARCLEAIQLDGALCFRMGGEEFLVVAPQVTACVALGAAEGLRLAVQAHDWRQVAAGLDVTCSIGVADWRLADDFESALHAADVRLYSAKNAGRNRCVLTV
ncbi:GGDEF domain-containing protein [Oryzibacter oryziterrae]|uniref:GGDEF domain-containing protein n=1 Tax=Oryzibacter oryziterrae TaxID=2766474 RepID=UPI001F47C6DD|nr:GGDEF domain-containing protein [Oryzibacter oryziterrae]